MKDILYDGSCDHDGNGEDGNDNDDYVAVHVQARACAVLNSPKESGNSCCNNDRSVRDALLMIVA